MNSHQNPLSVVIPTYNRADVLIKCLIHLENQTRNDFEVVVVDDGSTDSTPERIEAYAKNSPLSLRYLRQENRGPASARNYAISLVDAPICLIIGDDIFASPKLINEHLQLHLRRPERTVAALGLTRWSETEQNVTTFMRWLDRGGLQFDYEPLIRGERPDWRHFYTSNLSAKTEILKEFRFDESFPYAAMEDMELACRIEARVGMDLIFLPDATAYHLHPTTFQQACTRMIKVGESTAHFDRLWPGKRPVRGSGLKRILQNILLANRWAFPMCDWLANQSLKALCPNYLMSFMLNCHFRTGYDRGAKRAMDNGFN